MSHKSSYSLIELKIKDQKWCKNNKIDKFTKVYENIV